jgi:hypothetical protein
MQTNGRSDFHRRFDTVPDAVVYKNSLPVGLLSAILARPLLTGERQKLSFRS